MEKSQREGGGEERKVIFLVINRCSRVHHGQGWQRRSWETFVAVKTRSFGDCQSVGMADRSAWNSPNSVF